VNTDRRGPRVLPRRPFSRWRWLAAAPVAALGLGCGGGSLPRSADPDRASEALRTALDAWQRGEAAASLKDHRPAITVIDHDWQSGLRLTRYELTGAAQPSGTDRRCEVNLWLQDPRRKPAPKTVAYTIGTDPALTVVREDP
jgi:hypothetical protein